LPASDSGIYQAVSQISVIFVVVLGGLSRIVIPILLSLHHENRKTEMEEIYRVSTKWGLYISIPVMIVLLLSPRDVLLLTYGHEYSSGAVLILVLLIGQTVNLATGPVGPILVATGYQRLTFLLSGFCLFLNIGLNVLFVPRWGLLGAAAATSISLVILYVAALFAAKQKLQLWPYDRRYWKGLFAAFSAFLIAGIVNRISFSSILLSVLLEFACAITVFFAMLLLMKLDNEDLKLIKLFREKLIG
jgi:O-antigen/teichoic acid export membrane protein